MFINLLITKIMNFLIEFNFNQTPKCYKNKKYLLNIYDDSQNTQIFNSKN